MLVLPVYSLQVFSRVLASRSVETLVLLAVLALLLLLFQTFFEFIRNRLLAASSAQFDQLCAEDVVRHALANASKDKTSARQLLNDLKLTRQLLGSPTINLLFDLPWTPVFILVIFSMHTLLGWFALTATVILLMLSYSNLSLHRNQQQALTTLGFNNEVYLQKLLERSESIALFDTAQPLAKKWLNQHMGIVGEEFKQSLFSHILQAVIKYARLSLQVGVIGLGAWLVIINEVDPGVMLASSILLSRVLSPLDQGINQWPIWKQQSLAYKRVRTLFTDLVNEHRINIPIEKANISASKVYVKGSSGHNVLNNINFELKPNNVLAILGASGSGKSTLLKLLAGQIQVEHGEIKVGGIHISEILPSQRNQLIGYLPQRAELFQASVLDNISCFSGDKNANDKVFEVTKLIGIHQFISELPQAYNTIIGEEGFVLSGGQIQLVALARALFHQPQLLLLDEADSSLDADSQQKLIKVIKKLKNTGVSIVFVTHRKQLLSVCDWVMVMDKGNIIDAGKKEDVLNKLQHKNIVKKGSE